MHGWLRHILLVLLFARPALGGSFPGAAWEVRDPAFVGLSRDKLRELELFVGGRGCVVRNGYMAYSWGDQTRSFDIASALKPGLTSLLFTAGPAGRVCPRFRTFRVALVARRPVEG